jgi:hypothetical protein
MRATVLLSATVALLAACAVDTPKTPLPTGGSRADGSVDMSFEVSLFENPIVDWDAAGLTATGRCKAWGYRSADPFEGTRTECNARDAYGTCVQAFVTRTYQCV